MKFYPKVRLYMSTRLESVCPACSTVNQMQMFYSPLWECGHCQTAFLQASQGVYELEKQPWRTKKQSEYLEEPTKQP
jgi:ribosomal protein L37AE/L43A